MDTLGRFETHIVENQPSIMPAYNLWQDDPMLRRFVSQQIPESILPTLSLLSDYGQLAGSSLMEHGELANKNKPVLHAFDRYGRRQDDVAFHPSYHVLMESAMKHHIHNYSWLNEQTQGAHVIRSALMYMH